jgi:hypothetical protein
MLDFLGEFFQWIPAPLSQDSLADLFAGFTRWISSLDFLAGVARG